MGIESMSSVVSRIGKTSVSGYMRAAPGIMRRNVVVPSSFARRTSLGTPLSASFARMMTACRARSARFLGAQTMTNASFGPRSRCFASVFFSSRVMP